MSRISRDEMFMRIAHIVAERGTCDRAQVGAVLVSKGRVISIGYNGSLPGEPHCDEIGHLLENDHCIRTIHAEVNAINFANGLLKEEYGTTTTCTLYVTHLPCLNCCNFIAGNNIGPEATFIKSVIYNRKYPTDITDEQMNEKLKVLGRGGVVLEQLKL